MRGRGWAIWPEKIRLEPPFRPFEGHYWVGHSTEDDGRIESFGSRVAKGLSGLLGAKQPKALPPPAEIVEPDASPAVIGDGLVELQLALPPDYHPQANVFEQFLFSIGYSRNPVAFEVIGSSKELVVQVVAGATDAVQIRRQLKAFFPEAVITSESDYLKDALYDSAGGHLVVVEFGLEREFMVPLHNLKAVATDPLVAMCGALDSLNEGEVGVFQVMIEPVRNPWAVSMMRAVTIGDGQPFFSNDPELVSQTRQKVTRPLYAVLVRMATVGPDEDRSFEMVRSLAGALRPLGNPQGNRLVPLENEDDDAETHIEDLTHRTTHRSGMLLNSDELIALAHLPTAAVRAKSLRRALLRTRSALAILRKSSDAVCIGHNLHEGVSKEVWVSLEERLSHCHVLGGSGTGKSTILSQMAMQDIQAGRGVAVIDPHGDLIDTLLPHVPEERLDDVILFDPTDDEYAIAFNPLAGGSPKEKDLLATDFIALMRQHTSNWGDQMSSLLGNAVLAFLRSKRGGTLPELRRFLMDEKFRKQFLETVTDPEVVYYWEHDAKLTNKASLGSIGTRLDNLFWQHSVRNILGQRENRLNFASIMDTGKIFLARLSRGLIQRQNAYLLGGLLVSKFYQTAIARQAKSRESRRPYMLMVDEAGEMLTPTISEILVGARKYGLGLTLAHQFLDQLKGDKEVYGAVTGSSRIKVCFQVSSDDARRMTDEFGGFTATDLMNQPRLHALARVGPRDASFNLEVRHIPAGRRSLDEAYRDILARTRDRYCTPIEQIAAEMGDLGEFKRPPDVKDPFSKLSKKPVEPETSESEDANQESGATQTEAKPPAPSEPTPPKKQKKPKAPPDAPPPSPPTPPSPKLDESETKSQPPPDQAPTPEPETPSPTVPLPGAPESATTKTPSEPNSKPDQASGTKPSEASSGAREAPPSAEPQPPTDQSTPTNPAPHPTQAGAIPPAEEPAETRELLDATSEAIKNQIIQSIASWGFTYKTEKSYPEHALRVDLYLRLGTREIVCQICATTRPEHEAENLLKCVRAGCKEIALVSDKTQRRRKIEALLRTQLTEAQQSLVRFCTVHQFIKHLTEIGLESTKSPSPGLGDKSIQSTQKLTPEEQQELMKKQLKEIEELKKKRK